MTAWVAKQIVTPTGWNGAIGGPAGGYDIAAMYFDKDGSTAWLFQAANPGFARVDLNTNSIVFSGRMFNDSTNNGTGYMAPWGYSGVWLQDSNNNYYAFAVSSVAPSPNSDILYKLKVQAGSATDFGNGYMTTQASADMFSLFGSDSFGHAISYTAAGTPANNRVFDYLTSTYIGMATHGWVYIIDTSTMTLFGRYPLVTAYPDYLNFGAYGTWVDNNGHFWVGYHCGASLGSLGVPGWYFVEWNPASGQTGGTLNVTVHAVSDAALGYTTAANDFATYIPASNAVMIGSYQTGQWLLVDPVGLTVLKSHTPVPDPDYLNQDYFYGGGLAANLWARSENTGVQPNGQFAVQGANTTIVNQIAGVVNLIDPVNQTVNESINATTLINSTAGLISIPQDSTPQYVPLWSMLYSSANTWIAVSYDGPTGNGGSPAYLLTVEAASVVFPVVFVSVS